MNIEKISAALAAMVLGSGALVVALELNFAPNYSDFIVGSITWYAGNKFQDLIAQPAFIFVSFVAFIALSGIALNLRESHGVEASSRFASQLVLWSLPFYAGVGALILGGALDNKAIAISSMGIIFIGVISFLNKRARGEPDPDFWGVVFLAIALISLIPLEIAVLLSRAPMSLVGDVKINIFSKASYSLVVIGFIFGIFAFFRHEKTLRQHFSKFIFIAQIGIPVFFLTLYPARLLQPSGELIKYDTTIYLKIFVVGLFVFGLYDVTSRFLTYSKGGDWKKLFSPFALFGLVFALKFGNTIAPHISPDDYHFGEALLGWWSYLHGAVPYVDYIPPHGLVDDDFRLFLSSIFYDGSAATVVEAGRLAFMILGLIAFISIYYFSGSICLPFMVILMMDSRLSFFFLIPFICLWLSSSLRGKPEKWLAVWILTAPIVILGVPPQGLLLVAAFGLLAARLTWKQISTSDKTSWIYIGLATASFLLFFAATPLLSMLLGAIRYVLENGPINQLAYGVPWSLSWNAGAKSGFIFEAIRMSWVVTPVVCLYVVKNKWRDRKDPQSLFYPAIVLLIFSLLLIPYSMGRIDPAQLSRPGSVSIFCWAVLLPLLTWIWIKPNTRALAILFFAFMVSPLVGSTAFSSLISAATAKVHTAPFRDTAKAGLRNIGLADVDDNQWDRITRLDTLLKSRLDPDETYLDLTSRNAHYFYVNRLPILPVTAPYNLVHLKQQKRAVEALANPPKLALLQADNIHHDGGGLALRNPYLYRFVVDNYVPRFESGFIVGYRKSEVADIRDTTITAEVKNITDQNWHRGINRRDAAVVLSDPILVSMLKVGDQVRVGNDGLRVINRIWAEGAAVWFDGGPISSSEEGHSNSIDVIVSPQVYQEYTASLFQRSFAILDFQKIPVSWGNSKKSLGSKMTLIGSFDGISPGLHHIFPEDGNYKVSGIDPLVSFDISSLGLSGRNAGLLRFDFTCIGKSSEPRLQLFWWGDERLGPFEASSVRLLAENGTLIVPLDASPWWLTLRKIKGIRIDLDNATACHAFSVKNVGLYQRGFN